VLHVTYGAVLALTRIYALAGIDQVWPDFMRAYNVKDVLGIDLLQE
jgi:hypothetical protein